MLCDVTHHSRSDSIAPFVGLANSHSSLVSSASADLSDLHNAEMEAIAVIGTGLWLESKDLIFGTGPLFSFGMNEHVSCLGPSGCPLRMETHLLSSTLVNVSSSSSAFSPSKQLFGSEVRQLVVGGCVSQSTNHDSGTGMMSPNLGGNLKCLNTSFSSCIRDQNAGASFQNRNFTQDSEPGRFDDPNASATVSFECCTFLEMSFSGGWNEGAAAIFLSETNAQLSVRNSYFHTCRCEGGWESGGAIHFQCKSAFYARDIDLYHVTFTDCYAGQNGVCVYAYDASRAEVIVSEGGSNRTEECGSFSTSCGSIGIGWKCGTEEEGSNDVILLIHTSARFGTQIHIGQRTLEMRSLFEGEGRVDVEEGVRWEGKEEGVVVVAGGWLQMLALTLRLPRPSLVGEAKTASVVVSGFGECVLDGVRVVESWEGEGVGMGMVLWSGGSLRLTQNEMKSIWMESNVSLVKCSSSSTEVTLEMSDCMFIEVETRNAELVAFSSTLASS
ncbi:hypothetical protein BLNAU_12157 [Blattamonas nauphoetae]|uniref:Uncharacterized protein n=1 Tax=Blattamonas nauphoetae TaxID=2049346 RepID=A0ABQ9XK84_9EUKA|nr:hypothetical protein BLNAU_12157 [Blattamonas nauphoetae]